MLLNLQITRSCYVWIEIITTCHMLLKLIWWIILIIMLSCEHQFLSSLLYNFLLTDISFYYPHFLITFCDLSACPQLSQVCLCVKVSRDIWIDIENIKNWKMTILSILWSWVWAAQVKRIINLTDPNIVTRRYHDGGIKWIFDDYCAWILSLVNRDPIRRDSMT